MQPPSPRPHLQKKDRKLLVGKTAGRRPLSSFPGNSVSPLLSSLGPLEQRQGLLVCPPATELNIIFTHPYIKRKTNKKPNPYIERQTNENMQQKESTHPANLFLSLLKPQHKVNSCQAPWPENYLTFSLLFCFVVVLICLLLYFLLLCQRVKAFTSRQATKAFAPILWNVNNAIGTNMKFENFIFSRSKSVMKFTSFLMTSMIEIHLLTKMVGVVFFLFSHHVTNIVPLKPGHLIWMLKDLLPKS